MLSGVIFDLDGVIVDSHPLHKRAWRAFLASVCRPVSEEDLAFIFDGRSRREILIHFLGELSDSEIEEYGKKKDSFFRQACTALQLVPGSVEFIQKLGQAGLSIAVATSASRKRARWTLQELKIEHYFDAVVCGDDVAQSKPDPAIYRLAATTLSIAPESLFAIEDSVCGVRSARSAGLRCIGIAPEDKADPLLRAGAVQVIPDMRNLSIRDLEAAFTS
jgi:beta-phosphoglucomutase